jgi:hypothetical protein
MQESAGCAHARVSNGDYETLRVEIARLVLNRPETRNAQDTRRLYDLSQCRRLPGTATTLAPEAVYELSLIGRPAPAPCVGRWAAEITRKLARPFDRVQPQKAPSEGSTPPGGAARRKVAKGLGAGKRKGTVLRPLSAIVPPHAPSRLVLSFNAKSLRRTSGRSALRWPLAHDLDAVTVKTAVDIW